MSTKNPQLTANGALAVSAADGTMTADKILWFATHSLQFSGDAKVGGHLIDEITKNTGENDSLLSKFGGLKEIPAIVQGIKRRYGIDFQLPIEKRIIQQYKEELKKHTDFKGDSRFKKEIETMNLPKDKETTIFMQGHGLESQFYFDGDDFVSHEKLFEAIGRHNVPVKVGMIQCIGDISDSAADELPAGSEIYTHSQNGAIVGGVNQTALKGLQNRGHVDAFAIVLYNTFNAPSRLNGDDDDFAKRIENTVLELCGVDADGMEKETLYEPTAVFVGEDEKGNKKVEKFTFQEELNKLMEKGALSDNDKENIRKNLAALYTDKEIDEKIVEFDKWLDNNTGKESQLYILTEAAARLNGGKIPDVNESKRQAELIDGGNVAYLMGEERNNLLAMAGAASVDIDNARRENQAIRDRFFERTADKAETVYAAPAAQGGQAMMQRSR